MFGRFKNIQGSQYSGKSTLVPVELLRDLKRNAPIPVTIGGTSQRTFTLNASNTNPVRVWVGDDIIVLREAVTYSWVVGSNTILGSDGAETTLTNSTVGVWYMYVSIDSDGEVSLLPSASAPSFVENQYESNILGHPGTSQSQYWQYVGFMQCDATTPTFIAATKTGYTYEFAAQSVATTTTWALLDFSATVPAHGVEVGGYLETSSTDNDTTEVGTSSTDGQGAFVVKNAAAADQYVPFFGIVANSAGKFYGSSTTAAGDVHVTRVRDVV